MAENQGITFEVTGGAHLSGDFALPGAIVTRNEFNQKQGYAGVDDNGQISDDVQSDGSIMATIEAMQDLNKQL